jgi:ADP-ribosylglycohydrolase.
MRTFKVLSIFIFLLVATNYSVAGAQRIIILSKEKVEDKVKGAWAGKMIGVMYGRAMEFKATGVMYTGEIAWTPQMVEKSLLEDDIYGQLSFMMTMEKLGLDALVDSLVKNFANAGFPLCHANLQSRKNYFDQIPVVASGKPENNMHADDIDFQIESDFIGFINPCMPQSSNRLCRRVGSIMAYGDGMYGGMYLSSIHAGAYNNENIESIVTNALKSIPSQSTYALCIKDVLAAYHQDPTDWKKAWEKIQHTWGDIDICAPYHTFNIDAKLNGAFVTIGLLYGGGDFRKTMEITIRCGQDTDCNTSNAAAVLGVINGYKAIPNDLKSYIPEIADKNFLYTTYSYNKAVKQTLAFIAENVKNNGGSVNGDSYFIKSQSPVAPKLEQGFKNIRMDYQVQVKDKAGWKFDANWTDFVYGDGDNDLYALASKPGASVEIDFTGIGVSLLGSWNADAGKAKVYIDNRFVREVDTYYREEAGKYDVNRAYLFHQFGLKQGKHTLKLVVSENKNQHSTGNKLYLERMIAYKSVAK